MRILIAYAGKNGTTEACVERLTEQLRGKDVTVVCLERETADLASFDLVVVGSPVYYGKLRPSARRFLKEFHDILLQKPIALFLCCAIGEDYEYFCERLFGKELTAHAFATAYFGGSLRTEGLSLWDKLMVRSMRSSLFEADMDQGEYFATLPTVLPENIDKLAALIHNECVRLIVDKTNNMNR